MWPRLANVALGVWLMAAPAVLGHSTTAPIAAASDRIIGPLVVSAAIAAIWPEIRPVRWVNATLGVLAIVGPVVLGPFVTWPFTAAANSIVTGVLIVSSARVRGPVESRFGGGWRSLWRDDVDTVSGDEPPSS